MEHLSGQRHLDALQRINSGTDALKHTKKSGSQSGEDTRRISNNANGKYINSNYLYFQLSKGMVSCSGHIIFVLSSPSPVPNPSPKSKVQRKWAGTGADTIISVSIRYRIF